jgi:hypothetical protein
MDYEACLLTLLLSIPTPDLDGRCDMDILLKNFYKDTTLLFAFLISYIFQQRNSVFSHDKSVNSTFQLIFSAKRIGPDKVVRLEYNPNSHYFS